MKKQINFLILMLLFITGALRADDWQVVSAMPVPVKGAQAVVHDSLIYIVGGYTDLNYSAVNKIQVYNPRQNSWQVFADSISRPRYGLCAGNYRHTLVMFGGVPQSGSVDSSLEMWDYATSPYIYDHDRNFSRTFATAQIYSNSIFIFGGQINLSLDDTVSGAPYIVEYQISTSQVVMSDYANYPITTWGQEMPVQQMSALLDGNIYIFGGALNGILKDIHRYSIAQYKWEKLSLNMQQERAAGSAVALNNQTAAIIGGYDETNQSIAEVEVFFNDQGYFFTEQRMPLNYARSELTAAVYDGAVYVFGGVNSLGQCVAQVEKGYIDKNMTVIDDDSPLAPPAGFELAANYPNPFNGTTIIRLQNHQAQKIKLEIFDLSGQRVRVLVEEFLPAGEYQYLWDGSDEQGRALASGVYLYRAVSASGHQAKRMLLIR